MGCYTLVNLFMGLYGVGKYNNNSKPNIHQIRGGNCELGPALVRGRGRKRPFGTPGGNKQPF